MFTARSLAVVLAALLVAQLALASPPARRRRQLADDDALQPLDDAAAAQQARDKRKFEGVTEAKFGIKNAVLGFVFGSGATLRGRSTRHTPATQATSRSVSLVATRAGPSSSSSRSQPNSHPARSWRRASRQAAARPPADDIPVFDRNKVSLDFPGSLFGPSVSLLIRTTKIIGDVVQNSAVRYQTFLRLFRPLFRGQFEIKGLDPPTTTTTTTAKPVTAVATASDDNEINRRR